MNGLVIETSTERGLAFLGNSTEVLQFRQFAKGLAASRQLLPAVESLLADAGLDVRDLDWIAVGLGPGSYTGMRVAASAAQALALAAGVPLVGLSSLSGFVPEGDGAFASIVDARSGGAYLFLGERRESEIVRQADAALVPWPQVLETLGAVRHLVTPNVDILKGRLPEFMETEWVWEERAPDAEHLLAEAQALFASGKTLSPRKLDLAYLRKTEAEGG